MENKNYIVGLDIGTNSIGWCVSDDEYNILRLKGKRAYGSLIFSEAEDCQARRVFRTNKRRINRRKYRIFLLNRLFAEEITKIDKQFFIRLENSSFLLDDKKTLVDSKTTLFGNEKKEREFYQKYPTIWHLRKEMIDNKKEAFSDIRNVYLVLHHIVKYRGNFLKEGETINPSDFDINIIDRINESLRNVYETTFGEEYCGDFVSRDSYSDLKSVIVSDETKKQKQKALKSIFQDNVLNSYVDLFVSLATGGKFSLKKIGVDIDVLKDIQFDADYESKETEYKDALAESFSLVECAKEIYDFSVLNSIIGKNKYLCQSMVDVYETYKKDLKRLKQTIIKVDNAKNIKDEKDRLYSYIFKDKKVSANYVAFTKQSEGSAPSVEDFNKFVGSVLLENKDYIEDKDYDYFASKIEKYELLKPISMYSTSVIPYQLHLNELEIILNNASEYFGFIKNIKDKIIKLFLFRVPFYYGPLNDKSSKSNVVRKKNVTITPWNISEEDIIDEAATRAKFINKLINNCQYLASCKVIPKTSLLFEDYLIFEKLNTMNINGEKMSKELKDSVYSFIVERRKTTVEQIKTFLAKKNGIAVGDISISGIAADAVFDPTTHFFVLKSKLFDIKKDYELIENLVQLVTIYADNKHDLKQYLIKKYPSFTDKQLSFVLNLPSKKWSPFSRELLDGVCFVDENVSLSIIEIMRNNNQNLNQILADKKYGFEEIIKNFNKKCSGELTSKEQINLILDSVPSLFRRSIFKTLSILDDIKKITKTDPDKIITEVTREDDETKRNKQTNSRRKELELFLHSFSKDCDDLVKQQISELTNELNDSEVITDARLKSKHIYLYFKQLGYDLYTGKRISLEDVLTSDTYDIDHIVPQSLMKDDSLDNKVLVERNFNQNVKKDLYPLPESIYTESNRLLWNYLHKHGAISDKKYCNLIRRTEITLEELEQFVARQINAVNYSNIALRDVLRIRCPKTKIIFSKAQYPSFLRDYYGIIKNRNINDAHHAVDAYLNIVAGNILSTTYSNVYCLYKERKEENKHTSFDMEKTLVRKTEPFMDKLVGNCLRHDPLVVYSNDYYEGAFYKQTIYKADKDNVSLIPIHTDFNNPMNDTKKYGGYLEMKNSFLVAISYKKGKKDYKQLIGYKLLDTKLYPNNKSSIASVIQKNYLDSNCTDIQILKKIHFNQKVEFDGGIFSLWTKGDCLNMKNAYQSYLKNSSLNYLRLLEKRLNLLPEDLDSITFEKNRKGEKETISKKTNMDLFLEMKELAKNKHLLCINYLSKFSDLPNQIFDNLSLNKQASTLLELVKLFSKDARYSRYREVIGEKGENIFVLSTNITGHDFTLIYESPTGLFVRKEII